MRKTNTNRTDPERTRPRARRVIRGGLPAWMPSELIDRCGGRVGVRFEFSQAEKVVLRKCKPPLILGITST